MEPLKIIFDDFLVGARDQHDQRQIFIILFEDLKLILTFDDSLIRILFNFHHSCQFLNFIMFCFFDP